jgi:hypothetical protein
MTLNAICIACVWYKLKQFDICTGMMKVKIDRRLHVIHYGQIVQGHPTMIHVVADMHRSDAECLGMCDRRNIDSA